MPTSVKRGEAAMTFDEIARALGYPPGDRSRKAVFMLYVNALRKMRARPASLRKLKELVELRNSGRCF